MGLSTYQKYVFDSTIAITASAAKLRAIEIPKYQGVGVVPIFFFKLTVTAGTPAIAITAKPIIVLRPARNAVTALSLIPDDNPGDPEYALVGGATAKTLEYYIGGGSNVPFSAIAMTTGLWYMVPLNMDNYIWDGVELTFTESAGAGAAGTLSGILTIG